MKITVLIIISLIIKYHFIYHSKKLFVKISAHYGQKPHPWLLTVTWCVWWGVYLLVGSGGLVQFKSAGLTFAFSQFLFHPPEPLMLCLKKWKLVTKLFKGLQVVSWFFVKECEGGGEEWRGEKRWAVTANYSSWSIPSIPDGVHTEDWLKTEQESRENERGCACKKRDWPEQMKLKSKRQKDRWGRKGVWYMFKVCGQNSRRVKGQSQLELGSMAEIWGEDKVNKRNKLRERLWNYKDKK